MMGREAGVRTCPSLESLATSTRPGFPPPLPRHRELHVSVATNPNKKNVCARRSGGGMQWSLLLALVHHPHPAPPAPHTLHPTPCTHPPFSTLSLRA
jgi:hypothetical protein